MGFLLPVTVITVAVWDIETTMWITINTFTKTVYNYSASATAFFRLFFITYNARMFPSPGNYACIIRISRIKDNQSIAQLDLLISRINLFRLRVFLSYL